MENQSMYDVRPEQYVSVIRDLIKHEDDLTNHRLMWLLIIEGLLVNAYVSARVADLRAANAVALAGILVTLSASVTLYKSYQARGYLHFLGTEAKLGRLRDKYLDLDGWPIHRIKSWRKTAWVCPWLKQAGDVIEPMLFLPCMILTTWLFLGLRQKIDQSPEVVLGMAIVGSVFIFFLLSALWVWSQDQDKDEPAEEPPRL
jgi:hypothetical protein